MKWKIPKPKQGQKRTVKKFAFIPEELTDDEGNRFVVWFEFYSVEQEFIEGQQMITQEWKEIKRKVRK